MQLKMNLDALEYASPIIKGDEVTFLYKGKGDTVYITGDYNQWKLEDRMERDEIKGYWLL